MQNHKFKTSLVGAAIALIALSATAQVGAPSAAVKTDAGATSSALMIPAPAAQPTSVVPDQAPVLQFGNAGGSSNLDEITRLKFEKAKLELKKDIAKLRADIEEAETGKKPGMPSLAAAAALGAPQVPVGPSQQQILFDSVTLLSVYGSGDKLTAEIGSTRGRTVGRVGVVLPTGETVTVIKPDYVIVSQGKKSRRLNPTTEEAMVYANQQAAAATAAPAGNTTPGGMPMIQPFNPSDLLSAPTPNIPPGAPMVGGQGGKAEKKPAGL